MTVETIVSKRYKLFVLIPCACGCGQFRNSVDKKGRPRTYINGHHNKQENHYNWKGGIIKDSLGYIRELRKDHPKANSQGRVPKHRLVYEEYYNCCLLPWTEIDHINGIKNDNRIENLRPLTKSEHMRLHHMDSKFGVCNKGRKRPFKNKPKKDKSGRVCFDCLLLDTDKNKNGSSRWYLYQHIFLCKKCYHIRRKNI